MSELVFATNNMHKLEEVSALFRSRRLPFRLRPLGITGISADIPEDEDTLEGNASAKARFVNQHSGMDCFADDTGLEVFALDGRPGVYSARYAGEGCSYEDNVLKLLHEMAGISDRHARFRTVIHLILGGKEYQFEGEVRGSILSDPRGSKGFGYDPVFLPDGYSLSFAEMDLETKNGISHRAMAFMRMATFLAELAQDL